MQRFAHGVWVPIPSEDSGTPPGGWKGARGVAVQQPQNHSLQGCKALRREPSSPKGLCVFWRGSRVHELLVILALALVAAACGPSLTQVAASKDLVDAERQRQPSQRVPSRPILYLDVEGEPGKQRPVIAAVYPDGRRLGALVPGLGAMWSPTGTWFAYVARFRDTALNVMNLEGEVRTIFTARPGEFIFNMGWQSIWSPDGRRIALIVGSEDGSVYSITVIDVAEKRVVSRHKLPEDVYSRLKDGERYPMNWPPYKFRWSPDGRKLLLSWESTVVVDAVTGAIETIADIPTAAEWAPGSDGVYYFRFDFYLRKLGSPTSLKLVGKEHIAALGLKRPPFLHKAVLTLSPSGSKLSFLGGSTTGRTSSIHIYDLREGGTVALDKPFKSFQTEDIITALEWAPDENSIAIMAFSPPGEVTIKLLDLMTGAWRTLATVAYPIRVPEIDVLGSYKTLSWTE